MQIMMEYGGLPVVLGQSMGGLNSLSYPVATISALHWVSSSEARIVIASLLAGLVVAILLWLFSRWVHKTSNETLGQPPSSPATLPQDFPKNVDHRRDAGSGTLE